MANQDLFKNDSISWDSIPSTVIETLQFFPLHLSVRNKQLMFNVLVFLLTLRQEHEPISLEMCTTLCNIVKFNLILFLECGKHEEFNKV